MQKLVLTDTLHPKIMHNKTKAYPIHTACMNDCFPNASLRMLIEKNPSALEHSCVLDTGEKVERIRYSASECITKSISISGLPLHLYLSRKKNVDLEIVKLLISIYPDSINQKEGGRFPVNLAIKNNADINIIAYLMIYSSEDVGDMLLHTVYSSQSIFPIDLVNMIIKKFPRSLQRKNNSKCLPIHTLCKNDAIKFDKEDYFYDLLQLLIKQCPEHVQCSTAGGTIICTYHIHLDVDAKKISTI